MLRSWRVWAGFALSLIFIALFLRGYDLGELWDELRTADYIYVLPGIAIYAAALLLRAFRWQVLLNPVKRVGIGLVSGVMLIGYLANNLLPVRTGEVVRAYIIGERGGVSKVSALATILLERLLDVVTLATFLVIGALAVGVDEDVETLLYIMLGLLVASAAFLMFVGASRTRARAFGLLLVRLLPAKLHDRGARMVDTFLDGFESIRSGRSLALALALTTGSWLLEATTYYVIGLAFDLQLDFGTYLLVTAAANLAISVPSSAGGIGPFEFFARQTLVFAGIAESTAAAYTVALHAMLILSTTLAGFVALALTSFSFGEVIGRKPPAVPAEAVTK